MEYFDVAKAEAIGDAQRSYYQQTPDKIDLRRYTSTRACELSETGQNMTGCRAFAWLGNGGHILLCTLAVRNMQALLRISNCRTKL